MVSGPCPFCGSCDDRVWHSDQRVQLWKHAYQRRHDCRSGRPVIIGLGVVAGQVRRLAETLAVQHRLNVGTRRHLGKFGRSKPGRTTGSRASSEPDQDLRLAPAIKFGVQSRPPHHSKTWPNRRPHCPIRKNSRSQSRTKFRCRPATRCLLWDKSAILPDPRVLLQVRCLAPVERARPDKNRESTTGWRSAPAPAPSAASQPRPLHTANFDAMWPAEAKLPKSPRGSAEAKADTSSRDEPRCSKRVEAEPQKAGGPAVLKSGVVDGMSYTLYVDGSIEAELPQGTLRFASIHELRSHLAKKS